MGEAEPEEAIAVSLAMPGLRRACCGSVFNDRRFEWADVPVRVDGRGADDDGEGVTAARGDEATFFKIGVW